MDSSETQSEQESYGLCFDIYVKFKKVILVIENYS